MLVRGALFCSVVVALSACGGDDPSLQNEPAPTPVASPLPTLAPIPSPLPTMEPGPSPPPSLVGPLEGLLCGILGVLPVNLQRCSPPGSQPSPSPAPTPSPPPSHTPSPTSTPSPAPSAQPTASPSPPLLGNADARRCFGPMWTTVGTRVRQRLRRTYPDGEFNDYDVDSVLMGQTRFEGYDALMMETTVVSRGAAKNAVLFGNSKSYFRTDTSAGVLEMYGIEVLLPETPDGLAFYHLLYDPPSLTRFDLAPGATYEQTVVERARLPDGQTLSQTTMPMRTTYVGRETITVPAGTFETCRFERTTSLAEDEIWLLTTWIGVDSGLELRSRTDVNGQLESVTEMLE